MVEFLDYPKVRPCVVEEVNWVTRLERRQRGFRFDGLSPPGHTIQCLTSGRTNHYVSGRNYQLKRGMLIWFQEGETMNGEVLEAPWSFYTINFHAPALSSPPMDTRVRRVGPRIIRQFELLLRAWRDTGVAAATRDMLVGARLLELLLMIGAPAQAVAPSDPVCELWWGLEQALRQDLSRPVDLQTMVKMSGHSQATLARSCVRAVGMPPMKRLKQIRMNQAWGLVMFSNLRMKEIAGRIAYSRVHEFSRDYRKHFGRSPTKDRHAEHDAAHATAARR